MRDLYILQKQRLDCRLVFEGIIGLGASREKLTASLEKAGYTREETEELFSQRCFSLPGMEAELQAGDIAGEEKKETTGDEWLDFYQASDLVKNWDQMGKARVMTALENFWDISGKEKEKKILQRRGEREGLLLFLGIAAGLEVLGLRGIRFACLTEGLEGKGASGEILEAVRRFQFPLVFSPSGNDCLSLAALCVLGAFYTGGAPENPTYVERTFTVPDRDCKEALKSMILTDRRPVKESQEEKEKRDWVQVLETNVDDCSGEQLGYAIECLMEAGALDASCFPIYMKKGRPAYMLQVICRKERQEALEDIIFRETTSIGLRRYQEERRVLPRTFEKVKLGDGHMVQIKVCSHHGQKFYYPEYGDVKKVCQDTGRSYRSVYDEAGALAAGLQPRCP